MTASKEPVVAPLSGTIVDLADIPDAVFSQKIMGDGIAIRPSDGHVYAPFDGQVVSLFDTRHAVGLRSDTGLEVLIHIGIDTVSLNGKYYTAHVRQGDTVRQGDLLITCDLDQIKADGFDTITPVIMTNGVIGQLQPRLQTQVQHGEPLATVTLSTVESNVGKA